ncbi:hypothetical protein D7V86_00545 [bacterium D16-51]|nr:hypothetical protein D7V96_05310 [bacterium D16-59]RKI62725.1 hypothetical protein D7V86_00545 [bacterium D16-51]
MLNENIVECFNNIGVLVDANLENFTLSNYITDSLSFVSLIVELEEKFNIEIPDEYLSYDALETYADIENMIVKFSSF